MKKIIIILLLPILVFASSEYENIFKNANDFYKKGNYKKALSLYKILNNKKIIDANLFYNMGNSYFKLNKYGYSILYFEKALLLNPNDEDTLKNLSLVNTKNIDKILDDSGKVEIAGLSSTYSFLRKLNPKIMVYSFIILWLIFSIVIILRKLKINILNKNMYILFLTLFIILLSFNLLIILGNYYASSKINVGVVVEKEISALEGPDKNYKKLFSIHEGLKVEITDIRDNWYEITLPNGNVGWVSLDGFKKI